jgi:dTDP-4-amino-4,6-dideoxygalactose transaminase
VGRDRLAAALVDEGVHTKPYYEPLLALSDQPAIPVTSMLHEQVMALPMSSELCRDDAERVAVATTRALRRLRAAEPRADSTLLDATKEAASLAVS